MSRGRGSDGFKMQPTQTDIVRRGKLWALRSMSWLNGGRADVAGAASKAAHEFETSAAEISDRIYREGPWPTALRLTTPFTNRSNA